MAKPLRESMPQVAAWIDDLREAFGVGEINGQIRKGMHGEPEFWARENGQEVGTRIEPSHQSFYPEPAAHVAAKGKGRK